MTRKWEYRKQDGIESWIEVQGNREMVVAQATFEGDPYRSAYWVESLAVNCPKGRDPRDHAIAVARQSVWRKIEARAEAEEYSG